MIYKFKSPATADLTMLGPQGDQLLRLMGREPAAQGIFEAAALPGLVQALKAAIAEDEARQATAAAATASEETEGGDTMAAGAGVVSLRQRAWPLLEMFKRAADAGKPVVWGA